jgi:N-acetylmuramoyl-L-alanine amidase
LTGTLGTDTVDHGLDEIFGEALMRCFHDRIRVRLTSALSLVAAVLALGLSPTAQAAFTQCPAVGASPSCAVLITINPNGSLSIQTDGSVGPFDSIEDTLVGVQNNSGATVYGIRLNGSGIFGFDGDGTGGGATGYEGPGTSFTIIDDNSGVVNFPAGLANGASAWFELEGSPAQARLGTSVAIDPGHGTVSCPGGRTGATGPTNFPATAPPAGHIVEYKLAWAIASQLSTLLTARGYDVAMTKGSETACPTYAARVLIAKNAHANVLVSIHLDGVDDPLVHGSAGLYDSARLDSATLATKLVARVSTALGTTNNGIRVRNDLAVLNSSRMAAVLIEVATISNVGGDELIMHGATATSLAATAIGAGLDDFLNPP